MSRARHRRAGNSGGRNRDHKTNQHTWRKATMKCYWTMTKATTKTTKQLTPQIGLACVEEKSCHLLHAFCHGSILTPCGRDRDSYPRCCFRTRTGLRDSNKRDSGVGEGRGGKSHGRMRISEAIKDTSSICFLHGDVFDVFNVGCNFHRRPSHDVFGIELYHNSDDLCNDELWGHVQIIVWLSQVTGRLLSQVHTMCHSKTRLL